jgi:YidC/Oxa1 family membrane protein insertase
MIELWHALLGGLGTVLSFFYDLIPSYGVAIILLTIFVRVILLPLTIKQTRSMKQMQEIQPKVKELQRKYKGNRQKLNEELMKLYKEHQVNPLGGCLPLLLQLPVFFALYQVLTAGGGTQHIPDGSLKEAIVDGGERFLGMNLACSPASSGQGIVQVAQQAAQVDCGSGTGVRIAYFIMMALMVGTMFYQQKQMQRASTGPQAQQMKMMTTIMPAILGVFSYSIAAGVLVYWVTTNVWQIAQQQVMLGRSEPAPSTDGKGNGSTPAKKTPPKPTQQGTPNAGSRKKRRKR